MDIIVVKVIEKKIDKLIQLSIKTKSLHFKLYFNSISIK